MVDIRPVLLINGFLLLILALAMAVPLAMDWTGAGGAVAEAQWPAFLAAGLATAFVGLALILANRGPRPDDAAAPALSTRQAFLLTVSSWLLAGLMGALPLHLSSLHLSVTDAVFETLSGLTTTGATVLTGLDRAPRAVLLWRALLQWLGGAGIVATALTLLPVLRIGGMQLFRLESSDKGERGGPRLARMGWGLLQVYLLFTLLLAMALRAAGMTPFEAVCHAMSALATGGFSTSDQSLGHFGDAARWVCLLGMLVGGAPFSLYVTPWRHGRWAILRDSQIRWYLGTMAFFAALLTFWNWAVRDMGAYDSFRLSSFNVVAVLSTSGFHTNDYGSWGGFAETVFFMLAFVGGCTGSAAGGIKIFRYEVLFAMAGVHIKRLLHPHGVFPIEFNRRRVSEPVLRSVLNFTMLYFISFALLALALTMTGLDAVTGLSGAAAAIGNLGPGLGPVIGPGGNYHDLPAAAKWLLSFGMLLGRLEVAPLLILLTPGFWRD